MSLSVTEVKSKLVVCCKSLFLMRNIFCLIIGHFQKVLINQGLWSACKILCTNLSTETVELNTTNFAFGVSRYF